MEREDVLLALESAACLTEKEVLLSFVRAIEPQVSSSARTMQRSAQTEGDLAAQAHDRLEDGGRRWRRQLDYGALVRDPPPKFIVPWKHPVIPVLIRDTFVAKYSPSAAYLWVKSFGSTGIDYAVVLGQAGREPLTCAAGVNRVHRPDCKQACLVLAVRTPPPAEGSPSSN